MQKFQGGLGRGLGSLLPPPATSPSTLSTTAPLPPPKMIIAQIPQQKEAIKTSEGGGMNVIHEDRILRVSPNDIRANPRQPRAHFASDDLTDLMASIQEHGILQPLVVSACTDGSYELIAGERRLRAARAVGLEKVPVILREATERQKLEWALIENIQRADLNAVEEARAYRMLMDDFSLTQEDVAGRVGKSRSQIANTLRLLELPSDMLTAVALGQITKSHARTLLAEPNANRRRLLFERMLHGGVSVRSAESSTPQRQHGAVKDPNTVALEEQLRQKFATKVTIDTKGRTQVIAIHCYSREDLLEMVRRLSE